MVLQIKSPARFRVYCSTSRKTCVSCRFFGADVGPHYLTGVLCSRVKVDRNWTFVSKCAASRFR